MNDSGHELLGAYVLGHLTELDHGPCGSTWTGAPACWDALNALGLVAHALAGVNADAVSVPHS